MDRLTKKFEDGSGYEPIENHNVCNITLYDFNFDDYDRCVDKLGRLEDLEEELGCPLEVLIRGFIDSNKLNDDLDFKQKIMTYNCSGKLIEGFEMELSYGKNIDIAVDGEDNNNDYDIETITVQIKDYGKTWWLKGENQC